jgi:uncharacterized protein (DUF924 family)
MNDCARALFFMQTDTILRFWFDELTEKQHFAKDAALDALMALRRFA